MFTLNERDSKPYILKSISINDTSLAKSTSRSYIYYSLNSKVSVFETSHHGENREKSGNPTIVGYCILEMRELHALVMSYRFSYKLR